MVRSAFSMPRRFRVFAALIAVLLASTGLAACGGGGGGGSAQGLLRETFGTNKPVRSGNLSVVLNLDAAGLQGLKGPVSLKLTGPFQSQGKGKLPKFAFDLSLNTSGTSFTAGAVSTGDKGFVKVQGKTYAVTDSLFQQFKQGYEQAASKSQTSSGGLSFKSLGVDPLRWLKNPKNAGTENVGGADTYHVTAGLDIPHFLDDVNTLLGKAGSLGQGNLPSGLTASQRRDIERSVKSATLDVWTGKNDKTLRRLKIGIDIAVPADVQKRANGLKSGRLELDLTIADLNQSQTISAPANARPLSDLTSALGGASSGTSTTPAVPAVPTTPAPTGTSTAPAGASQAYLDCLTKAKNDVTKVQKCATLLGG
jgi:hypothetical protein